MKPKVFDLHCDTLDRLALSGDPTVPGGFYEHDAGVPRDRMSRLDDNDAHISLARMARFDWCQCFAVYVPDELHGDAAWSLFERVRRFWASETDRCSAKVARVRDAAGAAAAFEQGRSAAMLKDARSSRMTRRPSHGSTRSPRRASAWPRSPGTDPTRSEAETTRPTA